jgi:hypothetical protein
LSTTIAATRLVSAAAATVAAAARSTTASAVGSLVDANPTSVESGRVSTAHCWGICGDGRYVLLVVHGLHSGIGLGVLGIANKAKASAAASIAVLNHDLWHVSMGSMLTKAIVGWRVTYGFFDLTELFELLTESLVVGVPCEASVKGQWRSVCKGAGYLPNEELRHGGSDFWVEHWTVSILALATRNRARDTKKLKTGSDRSCREKEKSGKARRAWRLRVQAVGSNVTERTFDLVAPGCMGDDGASDSSSELGGRSRLQAVATKWCDGTGWGAEMVKRLGWRGKRRYEYPSTLHPVKER